MITSPDHYWLLDDTITEPTGPHTLEELRVMRPKLKGTKPKVCRDGCET